MSSVLRDVELGLDHAGVAGAHRRGVRAAVPSPFSMRICSMAIGSDRSRVRAAELVGDVGLGFFETHSPGHLHACHEISRGPHSAHARSLRVGRLHAQGIARAHLVAVDLEDLDEGLGGP